MPRGNWYKEDKEGGRKRGQVSIVSRVPLSIHSPWFLFGLLGPGN